MSEMLAPPAAITAARLKLFARTCNELAIAPALQKAADRFEITSPRRVAHFLAQCHHESRGFTRFVENLNYSAAALRTQWPSHFSDVQAALYGRTDEHPANQEMIADLAYGGRNGNRLPGDGWSYRGRGMIQLTGRANYGAAGAAVGLPWEDEPELVGTPSGAALSAAWFWGSHGLNALADRDDVEAITRRINGGLTGLAERKTLLIQAKGIWRD